MKLTPEQKDQLIEQLQSYFFDERHEELGRIGAENLIAFFMEEMSPLIYNRALQDARSVLTQQWDSLEEELYVLEKKR